MQRGVQAGSPWTEDVSNAIFALLLGGLAVTGTANDVTSS